MSETMKRRPVSGHRTKRGARKTRIANEVRAAALARRGRRNNGKDDTPAAKTNDRAAPVRARSLDSTTENRPVNQRREVDFPISHDGYRWHFARYRSHRGWFFKQL
jgi:hypothetical protein